MENENYLSVANSLPLWILCGIGVSVVALLCILYARLVKKNANAVGISREEYRHAVRAGMVTAIGPSIANVIVVAGLMAVIGGPVSWFRLSIIGAASTELTAARIGAEATGVAFGSSDFGLEALAAAFFAMAINGCGYLLFITLFTHRMEGIRQKLGGGDFAWLTLIGTAASIGIMSDLCAPYLTSVSPQMVAAIVGAVVMGICVKLSKKYHWIGEYALGFAIILGVAVAYFFL